MQMWFLYLLLCKDKSIYTGIAKDVATRFKTHKAGRGGRYTRSHKPLKILYSEKFTTKSKALKRETKIKSWRRAEKFNLIKFGGSRE